MPNIKRLDPGASPLHYFGSELRRLREEAGLTLDQLGAIVFLTGSMIGQVETATKTPKSEHVPRFDAALGADGALIRLWELVERSRLPIKLQQVAELEANAKRILAFQPILVPGLLQTEAYAHAVLSVMHEEDLQSRIEGRLRRQHILGKEEPPLCWMILGEGVLRQEVGGKETMRTQLSHLLSFQKRRNVHIQVLPFTAGMHAGGMGAFTLFTYDDQPDLVYSEVYGEGLATIDPVKCRDRFLRYDLLQAAGLPPDKSAEFISHIMEQRYGPGPEGDDLA
ncbi:helix-turn-helix domain-containing protein [Streptomyces sp. JJ66]|uniref:helix-turn-helix domain-containing protein n=1 Tax=Streptomyces sp. JJ66 TaxID=2803843 RepID=UPI001C577A02|nr:helix-turn-helix transcriptional regulator [Streptomyces sp. JJ66]MBW1601681.1 helix-turn-helix domain-containing protein [Streptomyces sp. JJ66]